MLAEKGLDDPASGSVALRVGQRRFSDRGRGRLWRNGDRLRCFDGPSSTLFDALGMVGELGVQELDKAVAFVGTSDDGELVTQDLEAVVPLLANEPTFAWWRRDETIDGSAISGRTGSDGDGGTVR